MIRGRELSPFNLKIDDAGTHGQESIKYPTSLREMFDMIKGCGAHLMAIDRMQNYGWLRYENIEGLVRRFTMSGINVSNIEEFCGQMTDKDWGSEEENMYTPHAFYEIAGYTLSAFINVYAKPEDKITLDISHLKKIAYIARLRHGITNVQGIKKTIETYEAENVTLVTNNLGPGMGHNLDGGTLEIFGDYLEKEGGLGQFMKSGRLAVHGNALGLIFRHMQGGVGVIAGEAEDGKIGLGASGGMIIINGKQWRDSRA